MTPRDGNRECEFDIAKLKYMTMRHFSNFFHEDQEFRDPIVSFSFYPTHLEDHQISLCSIPSMVEIQKTLFDMGPHKTPRRMVFQLFFTNIVGTMWLRLYTSLLAVSEMIYLRLARLTILFWHSFQRLTNRNFSCSFTIFLFAM